MFDELAALSSPEIVAFSEFGCFGGSGATAFDATATLTIA